MADDKHVSLKCDLDWVSLALPLPQICSAICHEGQDVAELLNIDAFGMHEKCTLAYLNM